MQRRLSKEESRQRYAEGRKLWNEFDPIGVAVPDEHEDEYDGYVGPALRLCEANKGPDEVKKYAEFVVYDRMGMRRTANMDDAIKRFSARFCDWYRTKWLDTVV
ncbi:MAG TPA: hypothetical protein VEM35_09210 [Rhizomicrobium sp.]|nr:hypothetical protein [Rhizomicrobium sp.]